MWTIEYDERALRDMRKLARLERKRILDYMDQRVAHSEDPALLSKSLQGKKYKGLCRFRVGDYRVICHIQRDIVTVLVVAVGHRREIYD